ncbi:hypothetical protein [Vibrio cholerae]|uniref:hypothetical protein n=1 Tax=Vibrio cholerae TaxID=666 RepID=UPI002FE6A253
MKKTLLACLLLMLSSGMSYTYAEEIEEMEETEEIVLSRGAVSCRGAEYQDFYVNRIYSGSISLGRDYPASVELIRPGGTKYGSVIVTRPKEPGVEYRNVLSMLILAKTLRTKIQVSCDGDNYIDTVYY